MIFENVICSICCRIPLCNSYLSVMFVTYGFQILPQTEKCLVVQKVWKLSTLLGYSSLIPEKVGHGLEKLILVNLT